MSKRIYTQKFRVKWKSHPKLRNWLMEDESDNTTAYCKLCKCNLKCKLCDLLMHADTKKHITRVIDQGNIFEDVKVGKMELSDDYDADAADPEESLSNSPLAKSKVRRSDRDLRQPRQKFCSRWEDQFQWLKPDKVDETLGICTICNKYLVCKKSHLDRHERSAKHRQRMQNYDGIDTDTETDTPKATEFLECGKREFEDDDEMEQAIEIDSSYNEELELKATTMDHDNERKLKNGAASAKLGTKSKPKTSSFRQPRAKLNRLKLLKLIDRDRHQLNEYLYARPLPPQVVQPRDSFDLFFESVSASVKTLPPKLATEVKSRVSQIMTEFELRAICEREAQECSDATAETTVVASSTNNEASPPRLLPSQLAAKTVPSNERRSTTSLNQVALFTF